MTVAELPTPPPAPSTSISQVTAVEQARAVAEVQAAVIVAQQVPRNVDQAVAEMEDACGRLVLAERAFYSVPNRGNGPSVHLARELARIWRNVDYGVKELRRDDEAGESEVLAFAWDIQSNTRSVRSFIVPHVRMKNGKRQPLIDVGDIYLSNQNVGARAVRECIYAILPVWFRDRAEELCHATLESGGGKPLSERVQHMLRVFDGIGVTEGQLARRIGKPRKSWTAQDVAQMGIVYTSITRDKAPVEEFFEPPQVTAAELGIGQPSEPPQQPDEAPPAPDAGDEAPAAAEPTRECPACGGPYHEPKDCPEAAALDAAAEDATS